jgi:hypothetical protein
LKLQDLQNRVLRAIGNLDRCTLVREFRVVFKIPHAYDFITKLCRTRAEVTLNYVNPNVHEARHRQYKGLKLGGGQAYDLSAG